MLVSEKAVVTGKLGENATPCAVGVPTAPQNCGSSLGRASVPPPVDGSPVSLRASYHVRPPAPLAGSTARRGKNLLLAVESSLTRTAALHVRPSLSLWRRRMNVSAPPGAAASV